ncbi:hypothetical protein EV182_001709 [Spiromyces aspiralis]|uniref:Uncharacterized protein n=1 Tax=Spiromyces aspiralis TaxID=68401 RepID=A0ACC1HWJ5_9FUNG|nr:hypothetical protein EV182_001709 [Spiromyces aspiralis]
MPDITHEFERCVELAWQRRAETEAERGGSDTGTTTVEKPAQKPTPPDLTKPKHDMYLQNSYLVARQLDVLYQTIRAITPAYLNLGSISQSAGRLRPDSITSKRDASGTSAIAQLSGLMGRWLRLGKRRLTSNECEDIDGEIKNSVRQLLAQIQELEEFSKQLTQKAQIEGQSDAKALLKRLVGAFDPRNLSGLRSAGVVSHYEIQAAHRSAVTWWLSHRLMEVNKLHAKMQRIRLGQKMEREIRAEEARRMSKREEEGNGRRGSQYMSHLNSLGEQEKEEGFIHQLSEQEQKQLQVENETVLKELDSTLDQVK